MKILGLDIETAPAIAYIWSPKTRYVTSDKIISHGYTLCWAAKWLDGEYIKFRSIHHHTHEDMVMKMWELLDEADAVLHYNGSNFDIPRLNSDFIKMGLAPPSPYKEIDLLKTFRKKTGLMYKSLDEVAKFLGMGGKVSHKGMALWTGCMAGNEADWRVMKKYNIHDVNLMIDVYSRVLPWIGGHPNVAIYEPDGQEGPHCPYCGSANVKANGIERTQVLSYQRYRCTDCGANMKGRFTISAKDGRDNIMKVA